MFKRNKYKFGLAAMISLFVLVGLLIIPPETSKQPPYVSFSTAPNGTKAIKLLLKEKGRTVGEWKQPWIKLPKQGQSLVIIEPEGVEHKEVKDLLQWVEKGNDLLIFQRKPMDSLPFSVEKLPVKDEKTFTNYRLKREAKLNVLVEDDKGILASQTQWGQGEITVFLTPDWLTNDEILRDSHFEKVWDSFLSLRGDIWFDEYHHGYRTKPGVLAVYPGWLLIVYAQLLLVLLLWLWWKGKRFGTAIVPRAWTVRRGDETLLAVAHWHQRTESQRAAIFHQERFFRHKAHERWHIRVHASIEEIASIAERKWDKQRVQRLGSLLERIEEMKHRDVGYSKKQFVEDSHVFDEMINAIEKE